MTATFWWILAIVLGIIVGNLWLIRRSKGLEKTTTTEVTQKKTTEGAVTGTVVAASGTDASRIKQVDTDHHSSSEGGSDGGSGSD
jgi:Na+/glutamate symporter